jgi:[ribosomal protein S5]-alanine N-acetyltransferase
MLSTIETTRLSLRPFEASDAEAAFGWFGDPIVMRYVPDGPDTTLKATRRRIADYQRHQTHHGFSKWLIVERHSGHAIGDAGLLVLTAEGWIDLGFRLSALHWGQGFGTEAASAWVRAAFEELGIDALGAFTHPDNRASIRILEKLGFKRLRRDTVMGMTADVFGLQRERSAG